MASFDERATDLLHQLTGRADARFRPNQLEAIRLLVEDRRRVLLVQRTGWGKSAVYFIATRLLRMQGAGPTVLVSPLLALMRNQIEAAERMGVTALTINSDNQSAWPEVIDQLDDGTVDLLLISPERLANHSFRSEVLPEVGKRSGLLVVDEAHCISDWGHDFRPDYRRIVRVLDLLPPSVPVLCCTATANDRVVDDVNDQLGHDLVTLRGTLDRDGLGLQAIRLPNPAQRMAWLATVVPTLPGSGIVYCLTVRDAENVAAWLRHRGIDAVGYHGASDDRPGVERALLDNEVKVVVATSALGMGFDKPDLSFVIHFQSPGSPVAYYQQVGRAGRQLDTSLGVLLTGHEDIDIQDFFIETAFPPRYRAEQVVELLEASDVPLSIASIEASVNIRRTRLELLLKLLEVDGAVARPEGRGYVRTARPWTYDQALVDRVTALRRDEQQQMRDYVATTECRMQFLRHLLDDEKADPCGVCDNCTGSAIEIDLDVALVAAARDFIRTKPVTIEPRRQWPVGLDSVRGRFGERQLEEGRALSSWGDAGWSELVAAARFADGELDDRLVEASLELITAWRPDPAIEWITYVPSRRRPDLVRSFAHRLSDALALPIVDCVSKAREAPAQHEMENSAQQVANVLGAFEIDGPVPSGPVLLVDDTVNSRWTFTVVGLALAHAGVPNVYPFALAVAAGG